MEKKEGRGKVREIEERERKEGGSREKGKRRDVN